MKKISRIQTKNKVYIDQGGLVEEILHDAGERRTVRFPVCLAVQGQQEVSELCADFVLSTNQRKVLVKTNRPFPKGSRVVMHFFIPPENKLLGEFKGRVVETHQDDSTRQKGMQIQLVDSPKHQMHRLQDYLDEKRRLVDVTT